MKQPTFINQKGAGRPAKHDRGVRHIARDEIKRLTAFHLTIKIEDKKSGLQNKKVLKSLHSSIKKARLIGLRILHYTLEYNHIHLLVEADNKETLGRGMQSFGISFSKSINKIKQTKGQVFKTRYHLRKLKTPTEIKNVINYIFGNGIRHKHSTSVVNIYNSLPAINDFSKLYPGFELGFDDQIEKSTFLTALRKELQKTLSLPRHFLIRKWCG